MYITVGSSTCLSINIDLNPYLDLVIYLVEIAWPQVAMRES